MVMETFDRILEAVDRLLYAVDEWLRFRTGQSRASLAGKAILGAIWFFVAYVLRIYVILMIEPQVNPIKHFPVVTVSHRSSSLCLSNGQDSHRSADAAGRFTAELSPGASSCRCPVCSVSSSGS